MDSDIREWLKEKPTTSRIFNIVTVATLMETYEDENLLPSLVELNNLQKYYRPVYGDGNCYYRAVMFAYICTTQKIASFDTLFPRAPIIDCANLPFELVNLDPNLILKEIWQESLRPLAQLPKMKRLQRFASLLNNSAFLDTLLIAYFRSLNHQYIKRNKARLAQFIGEDLESQLGRTLNYGAEAEGIQLYSMAEMLNLQILIYMVHVQTLQKIVFMEHCTEKCSLFFRPGHYDLIASQEQMRFQKGSHLQSNDLEVYRKSLKSRVNYQANNPIRNLNVSELSNSKEYSYKIQLPKKDNYSRSNYQLENRNLNINTILNQVNNKKKEWISFDEFPKSEVKTSFQPGIYSSRLQNPDRPSRPSFKKSEPVQLQPPKQREDQFKPKYFQPYNNVSKTRMVAESVVILLIVTSMMILYFRT